MSQQKRRPKKSTVTTLIVAAAAAIIVSLQPMLADYGIDLQQILTNLFRGQALQMAVYPSEGTAEVHFLDVGQASCILIKGSEKTALIDAGEADTVGDVTDYLAKNGVTRIDYFFNTHPHADHMGGCRGVMEAVPTGEFIMTDLPKDIVPTTVGYSKLIKYLGEHKDTTLSTVSKLGDVYELGGGLRLRVIGPVEPYDDLNNTSIVIRMDFGKTSFLFTGDMEKLSQRDILKKGGVDSVNLLSAPHHGSNTSIDYDFMKALNPQVSVISCGKDNDYGHPHAEVLKLYDKMGIEHLRTDRRGNIVAITDGENIKITAEREE